MVHGAKDAVDALLAHPDVGAVSFVGSAGVAAAMAFFPFSGWKGSFYGDLHATGMDSVAFYTRKKVITSRWF